MNTFLCWFSISFDTINLYCLIPCTSLNFDLVGWSLWVIESSAQTVCVQTYSLPLPNLHKISAPWSEFRLKLQSLDQCNVMAILASDKAFQISVPASRLRLATSVWKRGLAFQSIFTQSLKGSQYPTRPLPEFVQYPVSTRPECWKFSYNLILTAIWRRILWKNS